MSEAVDLAEGIMTKWSATSSITSVIPTARMYYGNLPGSPALPYATLKIEKWKDPEYIQAHSAYLCYKSVTFVVYADSITGLESAVDAISAAFGSAFTVPNSTILSIWFDDDEIEETDSMKDTTVVYSSSVKFNMMLQRAVS